MLDDVLLRFAPAQRTRGEEEEEEESEAEEGEAGAGDGDDGASRLRGTVRRCRLLTSG